MTGLHYCSYVFYYTIDLPSVTIGFVFVWFVTIYYLSFFCFCVGNVINALVSFRENHNNRINVSIGWCYFILFLHIHMNFKMKKAFTLVEMLIVIVIIGILAASLIPKLTGIQSRARDVSRKAHLQQLSTALATYQLDKGTYPVKWWSSVLAANSGSILWQAIFKYNSGAQTTTLWADIAPTPAFPADADANWWYRVQDVLGDLVYNGIMKELFVETNTVSRPYTYAQYNNGKIFSLMAVSEGAEKNANSTVNVNFTNAWTINNIAQITAKLCASVTIANTTATSSAIDISSATAAALPVADCVARAGDAIYALVN